ncbi:hypothetical protein B0H12DRAFT_730246 [Mycena haematopus]|nr:hypothetical protein B0H12DRAFT_730246 [Mycena haematopus]
MSSGNVDSIWNGGETARQFLHRVAACDAFHNSAERFPQPKCHPETRMKMLDNLWNWTCGIEPPWRDGFDSFWESRYYPDDDSRQHHRILWLYGPAGAGKSAIAQSLCEKLQAEGRLAANFFFKRGSASRGDASRLFATIAYQLADVSNLDAVISQNLYHDPAIVNKSFSEQLAKLTIEPCRLANPATPPIIIIDALDECQGQEVQDELLRSFANCTLQNPLPFYLLIASRPEPHIRETFEETPLTGRHRPLNVNQSFEDVRTYLTAEFVRIRADHRQTMFTVPSPWPTPEVINHLVEESSGYFMYASTVIRFIDDKYHRPSERLDIIMGLAEPLSGLPFAALHQQNLIQLRTST